jgi:SAM-dependent methyltransferase
MSVKESEEFWSRFDASSGLHPANLYRYNLISNAIHKWPGSKNQIIDLGCGNGFLLQYLRHLKIGTKLIGVDGSSVIINKNRQTIPSVEFYQADLQGEIKCLTDLQADIVICSEVIEHMPSYENVFVVAKRCLRDGGLFVLTTQGGKRRRHDIHLLGHLRHYEMEALLSELCEAGFEIFNHQKSGWPALTIQKIAASIFMEKVGRELASEKAPSFLFKAACFLIGCALRVSSKNMGPQLLIAARKARK